jgi:Domain of unknown function (DUF4124)
MRTLLFTLMSVAMATATVPVAATVYKWVDEDGVVHYSDQPHENAEKVQLKAPQTYSAQKGYVASQEATSHSPKPVVSVYQSCSISEPTNDQMFMNTSSVNAGVTVQPAVRPGDSAVVTMDGQRVPGVPAGGGQFTISPVDRGTHTLQVVIQDEHGNPVCQSSSVTFHVHQPSLQAPLQPVHPPRS